MTQIDNRIHIADSFLLGFEIQQLLGIDQFACTIVIPICYLH